MKLVYLLVIVLMLSGASLWAQTADQNPAPPVGDPSSMMGQGPMGGMMSGMKCPMCGGQMNMGGMGPGMMSGIIPGQRYLMMCNALNLTPDQVQKIRDIQLDFAKQMVNSGSGILLSLIDQQQALLQDNVDMSRLEKQAKNLGSMVTDLDLAAVRDQVAARNVLTPDQRLKAQVMMAPTCMPMGGMGMMGSGGMGSMMPMPGTGPAHQ